jgi:predicted PurR-regulated permease PerM
MNMKISETPVPEARTEIDPAAPQLTPVKSSSSDNPPFSILHIPVEARGLALAILATLAVLFALQWAHKFLVPLLFGIFIAYTLNPLVVWLERIKIPRAFGATLVMLTILCGTAGVGNTLHTEFQSILERLPDVTHKLSRALARTQSGQPSTVQQMQAAASEIEKATNQGATGSSSAKKALTPDQPAFRVSEWLWAGSLGAAGFIGQATMVLFLVFFLLLSGDTFKRKLVKLTGPSLSNKKITVNILDDINKSIQNYMFMLLVTNTLLAVLMWIALRSIGLENAGAWAVAAGLLHIIPYFGPLLIMTATGVAAFMQFELLSMALLVAGVSLAIATLVGSLITTWMTGRIAKMNPAAVFIALLFWGWLWGVWGLLIGIPITVIVKVISEHIDGMQPIAELLGE